MGEVAIAASQLIEEGVGSDLDGTQKDVPLQLVDEAGKQRIPFATREVIDARELIGVMTVPLRCQGQRAIPDALQVEHGLPKAATIRCRAGMDDIVPGEAGLASPIWLWRPWLPRCCRPGGNAGSVEGHPHRSPDLEIGARREREVDDQPAGQEEAANERRAEARFVVMGDRPLPVHERDPVGGDALTGFAVGDDGGDIEVGPAILASGADRTGDDRGLDSPIRLEALERSREGGVAVGRSEDRHRSLHVG